MYVHDLLRDEFPTEVVPGITAMAAATAAVGSGLSRHEDTVTVLPGTLPVPELARRLADTDAAVIMKLGRTFEGVREALHQAGLLDRAVYVEHASRSGQRVIPVRDVDPQTVPYMSIVIVPGEDLRADAAGRAAAHGIPENASATAEPNVGTVHVVGLGPGPDKWLSPEASEVLGAGAARHRLRALRRPRAPASRSHPARDRQHRRGGSRPPRPRSRAQGRRRRRGLGW